MRTDHEEPCGSSYSSFCLNGGICITISTKPDPFCWCVGNYTGDRCERTSLLSIKDNTRSELFPVLLASVVILSVLVAGTFFFLCRKSQIPRSTSLECGGNLVETSSSNVCDKITE